MYHSYVILKDPTESSAGGTLLSISNHLSYKSRSDLCIYKSTELVNIYWNFKSKEKNVIVGRIIMLIWTYVNNLLDTLSEENKTVLRLGDFV